MIYIKIMGSTNPLVLDQFTKIRKLS